MGQTRLFAARSRAMQRPFAAAKPAQQPARRPAAPLIAACLRAPQLASVGRISGGAAPGSRRNMLLGRNCQDGSAHVTAAPTWLHAARLRLPTLPPPPPPPAAGAASLRSSTRPGLPRPRKQVQAVARLSAGGRRRCQAPPALAPARRRRAAAPAAGGAPLPLAACNPLHATLGHAVLCCAAAPSGGAGAGP